MKKQLLFVAAIAASCLGMKAQTDVTSTYLTNADFSSTTGWTEYVSGSFKDYGYGLIGTYGVRTAEGQGVSTVDDTHLATEYCFGFEARWSGNYASYNQTTSELAVGVYTLTFDVENTNSKTNNSNYNNLFYVQVGDTKYTDSSTEWMKGKSSWTTHTITFAIEAAATATVSLGYGNINDNNHNFSSTNTPTLHVSHLTLTWSDPLEAAKAALQAEIDKAKLCDAKEGLATAIAAAESALGSATTKEQLAEALSTLQAADKDAVLRYENGLADATYAAPVVTSFVVNGTFTDNVNGWTCTGGFQNQARASNQTGAFTVPFFENWNGSAKVNKMYQTISNIPNGTYRLDIAAFVNNLADPNESQYVFANNDDKVYLTTGAPTAYEVYTVVTNNQIEIGLEQTTATANWMGIDNVSLRYYGAGNVINDAKNASHKLAWEEAKAAAEAALASDDYANVTGSEKVTLQAEVAKAEPSTADDYDAATADLTSATSAFTAAKASYDIFATYNTTLAYADEAKKPEITSESSAAALITELRAYYESHAAAEGVQARKDYTSAITNANDPANNDGWTWTGNKNNPASNEPWTDADGTNTHSYFDGGNWGASSWTTTMSQTISVPAGRYLLTAKGRAASNTTLTMAVGEASVDLPHVSSTGNVFDRGWGDASVEFTVGEDDATVTISVTASSQTIHEWFSVSDFRLTQLEETVVPMADADDYAALATAISTAEANALGFETGEYAPYNNVEALAALAAAKAINPEAEEGNRQKIVQNATAALKAASWTANTQEVNAIYNGNWANSTPNATSGVDVDVPGWTPITGMRMVVGDAETDPGLEYTTAGKALFSWGGTTITYGEQVGYTLPLKANTAYELTYKISAWRDGDYPSVVTLDVANATVVNNGLNITVPGKINDAEGNPYLNITFKFVTSEASDYILKLFANQHFTITDINLVKVATTEIAGTTVTAANKYGTFISPIARKLPAGLSAYGISGIDDKTLVLSEPMQTLPANIPVILENSTDDDIVLPATNGQSLATALSYTDGYLTGVYAEQEATVGTYVLQNQGGVVGFYQVGEDVKPTVGANRAYMTLPAPPAPENAKAFYFPGENATAIEAISALANGEIEAIYSANGAKLQSLQKGLNIVKMQNGTVQKVLVK